MNNLINVHAKSQGMTKLMVVMLTDGGRVHLREYLVWTSSDTRAWKASPLFIWGTLLQGCEGSPIMEILQNLVDNKGLPALESLLYELYFTNTVVLTFP